MRRLGAFQRYAYMPEYDLWARKVCHVYLARPALRVGAPAEKGHAAYWMPLETAVSLVANDGDRRFLAAVARKLDSARVNSDLRDMELIWNALWNLYGYQNGRDRIKAG